jgi:hypothetical protein
MFGRIEDEIYSLFISTVVILTLSSLGELLPNNYIEKNSISSGQTGIASTRVSDPDPHESRSRRAKMTHKNRKKVQNSHV